MEKESVPKQEIKEEKPQHEIELEQRPTPQDKEDYIQWIERIGGPYVEVKGNLKTDSIHKLSDKEKENAPLTIGRNGDFILNDKNLGKYFNEKSINKLLEEENPNIHKKETEKRGAEYRFKKDLFETPADYFDVIIKKLGNKQRILADKAFAKNVKKWAEEFEEEKAPPAFEEGLSAEDFSDLEATTEAEVPTEVGEKEVKEEPEKTKEEEKEEVKEGPEPKKEPEKSLTLDEEIEQKEEELEEVEQNYNIYYSPVVQSLFGLYYKAEFKSLKKEVKKLKKARKIVGGEVAAIEEKPEEEEEYSEHTKYADKLFIEMARVKGAVNEKEADPSEYEEIKSEWRTAYKKIREMYDSLSEEEQEEAMKEEEKPAASRKKIKKKWKELWKLLAKKVGKETIEEVTIDAIEEQLKEIKKNLRKVSKEIKEGGVLGRAAKEKEQTNLEKEQARLKEMKKKIKERLKIQKRLKEIPKEIKKSGVLEQTKLEGEQKKLEKRLKKLEKI